LTSIEKDRVYQELWVSLSSLLRSYVAAHGLNGKLVATVTLGEECVKVRCGERWLELERQGAEVNWKREDGSQGVAEFMEDGRLRCGSDEEEMDLKAEMWARELMR